MKLTKTCARFLRKHGGTLLAIGASVGVVLTAIETGKATIKAEKLVELNKDVDDAMMKLWKDFGRRLLHVLDGTMRYVLTMPIRLYEYIYDTISGELESQRETENRFENLKQHGHI